MLHERDPFLTLVDGVFLRMTLSEVATLRKESENKTIWSARLSTGLFGRTSCRSGNRGPKSWGEVILASGDEGLRSLIGLGFIPCGVCLPDHQPGFWEAAGDAVKSMYNLKDSRQFADKLVVGYDIKRVNWETLLPLLSVTPNRLYIQQDSLDSDYLSLKGRFGRLGFGLPECWYYDGVTGKSRKYEVPSDLVK